MKNTKIKIKRISIEKYKNLVDFECEFSESNISAFIGNNGSGKSNLLEVISEVFSYVKKKCEDKLYSIIKQIDDIEAETKASEESYKKLLDDYKDVVIHSSAKPLNSGDKGAALPTGSFDADKAFMDALNSANKK